MKLCINNFAKIKEADIIIDGITIIAGENNTGKSTVGKILFSFFNAFSGIEEKILDERLKDIDLTDRRILQKYARDISLSKSMIPSGSYGKSRGINRRLEKYLEKNDDISEEVIQNIIEQEIKMWERSSQSVNLDDWREMIDEISHNINEILLLSEESIIIEIISRYFKRVFHEQMNSLTGKSGKARVDLEIKGKKNSVFFTKNECKKFEEEISIMHKAIYIDNPFVVDELSEYNDLNPMNELLKNLLCNGEREGVMDGIIESVRAKEKLNDIYETLQNVVDGEIVFRQNSEEFYLKNRNLNNPISLHNLSTGMKSFVILKLLLERGGLKEKDVVILDEPEIHLHPQWQIAYAELIVLLQKQFDLSLVVTTHSPYFVDAVDLFSCKYGTKDRMNYYLSSLNDDVVKMECVTGNIDRIYKEMASPIQMLDTLRYELNNN